MKRIGVLTGGGDCPGLNAVIRAVAKSAINLYGWEVIGFEDGFKGLVEKNYRVLDLDGVSGIIHREVLYWELPTGIIPFVIWWRKMEKNSSAICLTSD